MAEIDIDWSLLKQPNIIGNYLAGSEAGQKMRRQRDRQAGLNLLANDPTAGANALIASDNADAVTSSLGARNVLSEFQGEEAARPFAQRGDYAGAANAAAPFSVKAAKVFSSYGQEELDRVRKQGERSAAVVMAASRLGDSQQRRAYIDQHKEELTGLGYSPEQLANYDVSDPMRMRADAARFMDLGALAGKVSVEKFGDNVVTYETNPIQGTRQVSSQEIPRTRAEALREREFEATEADREDRRQLDREGLDIRRAEAGEDDITPNRIVGRVLSKVQERGVESLSPGEKAIWERYNRAGQDPYGDEGYEDAPAAAPAAPAAAPRGSAGAKPATAAPPATMLKEGAVTTFKNGQVWTLRGGKQVRVK